MKCAADRLAVVSERGLYFHEIWQGNNGGSMLCGTMMRNTQDLDFLHHREGVNVILNVRATSGCRFRGCCATSV